MVKYSVYELVFYFAGSVKLSSSAFHYGSITLDPHHIELLYGKPLLEKDEADL